MSPEARRESWRAGMDQAVVPVEKTMKAVGVEASKEGRKTYRLGEDVCDIVINAAFGFRVY